jgi:hypothetical protein
MVREEAVKPSRWSGEYNRRGVGKWVPAPFVVRDYYRRLCAHYIGEARRWMKVARAEHDLAVAVLTAEPGVAVMNLDALLLVRDMVVANRPVITFLDRRDGHPMDDAERGTG